MNLGGPEILVIIVVAVLLLGPDKLPSALRTFGRVMGEFRKYQDMAKNEIEKAMQMPDTSVEEEVSPEASGTAEIVTPTSESHISDRLQADGTVLPIEDD